MEHDGRWYSASPKRLRAELDGYLGRVALPPLGGELVALVSPHGGYHHSGRTAAYGFAALGRQPRVDRVVILASRHRRRFLGIELPRAARYAVPGGTLAVDRGAIGALASSSLFTARRGADAGEHAVELQLPFLHRVLPKVRIVPMVVGGLSAEQVGRAGRHVAALLDGKTVLLASSDFTHRGKRFRFEPPRKMGVPLAASVRRLDFGILPALRRIDAAGLRADAKRAGLNACGLLPIAVMVDALKRTGRRIGVRVLHYSTSAGADGDWRESVSYMSIAFVADKGNRRR